MKFKKVENKKLVKFEFANIPILLIKTAWAYMHLTAPALHVKISYIHTGATKYKISYHVIKYHMS